YRGCSRRDDPARAPYHDHNHGDSKQQHSVERRVEVGSEDHFQSLRMAECLEAADHDDGGQCNPELAAETSEHDDGEDRRRLHEGERLRADEALPRGEESSGKASEHRPGGESSKLADRGVDAERAAGNLILPHRLAGPPDGKAAQPQRDEIGENDEQKDYIAEEDDGVERIVAKAKEVAERLSARPKGKPEERGLGYARDSVRPV